MSSLSMSAYLWIILFLMKYLFNVCYLNLQGHAVLSIVFNKNVIPNGSPAFNAIKVIFSLKNDLSK